MTVGSADGGRGGPALDADGVDCRRQVKIVAYTCTHANIHMHTHTHTHARTHTHTHTRCMASRGSKLKLPVPVQEADRRRRALITASMEHLAIRASIGLMEHIASRITAVTAAPGPPIIRCSCLIGEAGTLSSRGKAS